jgi:hypothetical protein
MKIVHKFVVASGPSIDDYHWLGYRYPEDGFKPDTSDSWIGHSSGGLTRTMNLGGWVTDLKRTDQSVWATESPPVSA